MALAANAIVSLADVKAYLRITTSDDDSLLETLIDTASTRIESYCDRKIIEQTFRESYNANGQRTLRLRNYPVSSITRLATGNKLAFTVSSTVSTDVRATVEVQDNRVLLDRYTSDGTHSHLEHQLRQPRNGLGDRDRDQHRDRVLGDPWNELPREDSIGRAGSTSSHPRRVSTSPTKTTPRSVFTKTGRRSSSPTNPTTRSSVAATTAASDASHVRRDRRRIQGRFEDIAAVPEDLKQAARMLVQYLFEVGAQDPTLASETIGAYSYSRSTDQLIDEAGIAKLLAPYMDRKS